MENQIQNNHGVDAERSILALSFVALILGIMISIIGYMVKNIISNVSNRSNSKRNYKYGKVLMDYENDDHGEFTNDIEMSTFYKDDKFHKVNDAINYLPGGNGYGNILLPQGC